MKFKLPLALSALALAAVTAAPAQALSTSAAPQVDDFCHTTIRGGGYYAACTNVPYDVIFRLQVQCRQGLVTDSRATEWVRVERGESGSVQGECEAGYLISRSHLEMYPID